MMTEPQTELDNAIIEALEDLPLAPLPPGFVYATMRKITPKPRFRLQFLDLALPVLSGVFFVCTLMILGWFTGNFTYEWLPYPAGFAQGFFGLITQLPGYMLLALALGVEAALVMVVGITVALWLDRPLVSTTAPHGRT